MEIKSGTKVNYGVTLIVSLLLANLTAYLLGISLNLKNGKDDSNSRMNLYFLESIAIAGIN